MSWWAHKSNHFYLTYPIVLSLGAFLISSLTYSDISLVQASIIGAMISAIVRIFSGIVTNKTNISPKNLLMGMFVFGTVGTSFLSTSSLVGQFIGALLAYGAG